MIYPHLAYRHVWLSHCKIVMFETVATVSVLC